MEANRIDTDEMKAIELDIMRELYKVCHEEGLKCAMAYGTLLGAIRHHGFIPWDDDIDLLMPRTDYERLPELFAEHTSKPYYKIIWYRDRSSIYPFIKVVDTRTEVIEHYIDERWNRVGVWVDIFPVDGMGPDDQPFESAIKLRRKYDYLAANVHEGSSAFSMVGKRVLKAIMPKEDIYQVASQMDDLARAVPLTKSEEVAQLVWPFGSSERMPSSIITDLCPYEFEGEQFEGPRNYDLCLTRWYGDYMTPPPENERIPHYVDARWL
jgi:lipopolysaccharide cholinephosphotransferase